MPGDYVILGLSSFGFTLALELQKASAAVMVVDRDADQIQRISPYVTKAVIADVRNQELLEDMEVPSATAVVVAMPKHFDVTVLVTHYLSKSKVKRIYAQVSSEEEAEAIRAVGATTAVLPDYDMALRMAGEVLAPGSFDRIYVEGHLVLQRLSCPPAWTGKSLTQLGLRKRFGVNVVAVYREVPGRKEPEGLGKAPDPEAPLGPSDILLLIGTVQNLSRMQPRE